MVTTPNPETIGRLIERKYGSRCDERKQRGKRAVSRTPRCEARSVARHSRATYAHIRADTYDEEEKEDEEQEEEVNEEGADNGEKSGDEAHT